jgi:hypothetical protein
MPVVAPRIGEEAVSVRGETIAFRLALIPFNSPWSLAGVPVGASVRPSTACRWASPWSAGASAGTVLRRRSAYQRAADWHEATG